MTTDPTEEARAYRIEHDSMGEVRVPREAKWRATTQRAVENFPISGQGLEPAHIAALGAIKAAAAQVNGELGILEADVAEAIRTAAEQVAAGTLDREFPIDVFQTGSGTSSNMPMSWLAPGHGSPPPLPRWARPSG